MSTGLISYIVTQSISTTVQMSKHVVCRMNGGACFVYPSTIMLLRACAASNFFFKIQRGFLSVFFIAFCFFLITFYSPIHLCCCCYIYIFLLSQCDSVSPNNELVAYGLANVIRKSKNG